MKLSLSSLPALTFYAFPLQTTWVWLFQENVKHFKGQAALFARHLLSLFSWSCLLSCPGDFLWCIDFLISPSIFPCLHWLTVAETGHCFSKQICSPMPTGISCLQEPPFTRYQLFENICVLPHQNNLLISNYFFSSNIIWSLLFEVLSQIWSSACLFSFSLPMFTRVKLEIRESLAPMRKEKKQNFIKI